MAMVVEQEIIEMLMDYSGNDNVTENADIFGELDMWGDDFHEIIENYAEKYSVDVSTYLWYFHTDEDGLSVGGRLFKPPYMRVKRIPVTPLMLSQFAASGKWDIDYPEHVIPKRRYDILIDQILGIVSILYILFLVIGLICGLKYV